MTDIRITTADPLFPAARATGNRDRSMPVVGCSHPVGHWGDPRTVPFDARRYLVHLIRTTAVLIVGVSLVAALWWLL